MYERTYTLFGVFDFRHSAKFPLHVRRRTLNVLSPTIGPVRRDSARYINAQHAKTIGAIPWSRMVDARDQNAIKKVSADLAPIPI